MVFKFEGGKNKLSKLKRLLSEKTIEFGYTKYELGGGGELFMRLGGGWIFFRTHGRGCNVFSG